MERPLSPQCGREADCPRAHRGPAAAHCQPAADGGHAADADGLLRGGRAAGLPDSGGVGEGGVRDRVTGYVPYRSGISSFPAISTGIVLSGTSRAPTRSCRSSEHVSLCRGVDKIETEATVRRRNLPFAGKTRSISITLIFR